MELRTELVVKKYRQRTVVKGVSVGVKQGQIVGLLGPNGAGKTTTFYMIVGIIKPNGGRVFIDDRDITDLPMYRRAQMGVGYLAQEASVFRQMTVAENIMSVLEFQPDMDRGQREAKLNSLLDMSMYGKDLPALSEALKDISDTVDEIINDQRLNDLQKARNDRYMQSKMRLYKYTIRVSEELNNQLEACDPYDFTHRNDLKKQLEAVQRFMHSFEKDR